MCKFEREDDETVNRGEVCVSVQIVIEEREREGESERQRMPRNDICYQVEGAPQGLIRICGVGERHQRRVDLTIATLASARSSSSGSSRGCIAGAASSSTA